MTDYAMRSAILLMISDERDRQERGIYNQEHDDQHTLIEMERHVRDYMYRGVVMSMNDSDDAIPRAKQLFMQAASIIVAMLEKMERESHE